MGALTGGVRPIPPGDDAGLEAYVRIRTAVTPDNPDSIEQARWVDVTYPGDGARFLAETPDGTPVGCAVTGRIWMHAAAYERYWLGIWVLPGARGQGMGSALFAACSEVARAAGKTGFETELSEAYEEGHRFLAHRGFTVVERNKMVRLDLAGATAPDVRAPAGIRIVSLAEQPELVAGVHATAVEAFPDIPSGDEPVDAGGLEAFIARDVDRVGIPKDGFMVAVDEASGEVAGYASLILEAGSTTVAYHDMTAVRRAFRGRGIARALKRATIAWAVANGIAALDTGNDEDNAPMRAINLGLGYRPMPDWLGLHGPLAPPRA